MFMRSTTQRFLSNLAKLSSRQQKSMEKDVPNYLVRSLTHEDIPGAIELARQNTFQYTLESLRAWSKHDPDGIKVAVTDSGEVIGMCGNVKHSDILYFGGTLIVQEKFRRHAVGSQLFNACFRRAHGNNIALNCSAEKVEHYKKRGFEFVEEDWTSYEYESRHHISPEPLSDKIPSGVTVEELNKAHLPEIIRYDSTLGGLQRTILLGQSCFETNTKTLVALKKNTCVGFGLVRTNIFQHSRVGPLYADDPAIAEVLFKKLLETFPQAKGLALVTFSNNAAANEMVKKVNIGFNENLIRMYTKEKLALDTDRMYIQFDVDFSPF